MACRAARLGDAEGVRWPVDALLRWPEELVRANSKSRSLTVLHRRVPASVLEDGDWSKVRASLLLSDASEDMLPGSVFDAAAEAAWTTVVVALTGALLSRQRSDGGGGPASISARMQFRHELHDTAVRSRHAAPLFGGGLDAVIRTVLEAPRSGAEGIAASPAHEAPRAMVAMRMYLSSGPASGLERAEALLLVASAAHANGQPVLLAAPSLPTDAEEADALREFMAQLDRLGRSLTELNAAESVPVVVILAGDTPSGQVSTADFNTWRNRAAASVWKQKEQAAASVESVLLSRPLGQAELGRIAGTAIRSAFATAAASCPLNLFQRVELRPVFPDYHDEVSSTGHSRGEFMPPPPRRHPWRLELVAAHTRRASRMGRR